MHFVLRRVVNFDGSERSEPDVQGNISYLHALCLDFFEQFLREMQACCRRGNGAVIFCVYGLITVRVFEFFVYIRRQRHFAELFEPFGNVAVVCEFYRSVSVFRNVENLALHVFYVKYRSYLCLFARFAETFPNIGAACGTKQKYFDHRARVASYRIKSCGNNSRIVQHKAVALVEIIQNVGKMTVRNFMCFSV